MSSFVFSLHQGDGQPAPSTPNHHYFHTFTHHTLGSFVFSLHQGDKRSGAQTPNHQHFHTFTLRIKSSFVFSLQQSHEPTDPPTANSRRTEAETHRTDWICGKGNGEPQLQTKSGGENPPTRELAGVSAVAVVRFASMIKLSAYIT